MNADQTVIILWDADKQMQHFIRRASFKGDADDFGFLVPSPSQPELCESGDGAFPFLAKLTEPETTVRLRPLAVPFGCSAATLRDAPGDYWSAPPVKVLEEKTVAGFNAVVLEAKSGDALGGWLKDHGCAFSPQVEAWARPYVEKGWKITALKVCKDKDSRGKDTSAAALRMSFKTDRPLFPYREPEYKKVNETVGAKNRLLRIYFLAEARYEGALTKETPWSGQAAWAGKLKASERTKMLELLKLPEATGPAEYWLTEFEDNWAYTGAPADVYFSRAARQEALKRPVHIRYVSASPPADATLYAFAAVAFGPALVGWIRRRVGRRD